MSDTARARAIQSGDMYQLDDRSWVLVISEAMYNAGTYVMVVPVVAEDCCGYTVVISDVFHAVVDDIRRVPASILQKLVYRAPAHERLAIRTALVRILSTL